MISTTESFAWRPLAPITSDFPTSVHRLPGLLSFRGSLAQNLVGGR
jgi:hypothetical protein